EIAPQVWKAFAGIRVVNASTMTTAKSREIGKEMARAKVVKMFPEHEEQFRLKKHDGRADACLIGWYGLKKG
ncbi:MAG: hypothetical protein KGH75_09885, partial [Rhodospirillales bacterium]|nr:hypothetical protein [Rhodospirillales bacterium]